MYDHRRIRSNARQFYGRNTGASIGATAALFGLFAGFMLVAYIIIIVLALLSVFGASQSEHFNAAALIPIAICYVVLPLVEMFLLMPIMLGYISWFQQRIRNDRYSVGEIFRPFKVRFLSNVGTMLLKGCYLCLWALLWVAVLMLIAVPVALVGSEELAAVLAVVLMFGIYIPIYAKYYSYSMVEFIKGENPSIGANAAITLSKRITKGFRTKLLYLDLSFIGWYLLSSLTGGILLICYVGPYYMAARAFSYEELKAEAISSGIATESDFGG